MTREHNHFYTLTPYSSRESVLSISAWDYSAGHVEFSNIPFEKPVVISSTIWGLTDFEHMSPALYSNPLCRLQISWGGEFQRYSSKILPFLEKAGQVDILIDRPLDAESVQEILSLCQNFQVRLGLVVNRYFSFEQTVRSLGPELRPNLVLHFFPPSDRKSVFYSPDEVIKLMDEFMDDFDAAVVIFDNIIESNSDIKDAKFYLQLSREDYFSGFTPLEQYRALRRFILWSVRKNFVVLLDGFYAALMFIKNPSWRAFLVPWKIFAGFLGQQLAKFFRTIFYFVRYDLYHLFRYKLFHFIRYEVYYFFRYKIPHLFRHNVYGFIRYRVFHIVRYDLYYFIRYKVFHFFYYRVPGMIREGLRFVLYPAFKVYWFSSYQFKKRILPYWRKRVREE